MLASITRFPRAFAFKGNYSCRRRLSIVSVHTSFPASLYRFQVQRSSGLFEYKEHGDADDGLEVAADGLVYPRVSDDVPFSNGAVFMPNTFDMQELLRTAFDDYVDGLEHGQTPSNAAVLRIPKGTSIPNALTLFRERSSRFSLQPSRPMKISDLNDLLSSFYSKHAVFAGAEEWMDGNEYHDSAVDSATEEWMCR